MPHAVTWKDRLTDLCPWMGPFIEAGKVLPHTNEFLLSKRRRESVRRAQLGTFHWNNWAKAMLNLRMAHPENPLVRFAAITDWQEACFEERVDLAAAIFPASLYARHAKFQSDIFLTASRVYGHVDLKGAHINRNGLWLDQGQIYGNLTMQEVYCEGRLELRRLVVAGQTNLSRGRFEDDIWVQQGRFLDELNAKQARFHGRLGFHESQFSGPVNFQDSQFETTTGFERAIFKGPVSFENSLFNAPLFLDRASFHGQVRMGGVRLRAEIRLDGVEFQSADTNHGLHVFLDKDSGVVQAR